MGQFPGKELTKRASGEKTKDITLAFPTCVLQKEALMEQVAHQVVVMQFILEMASNSQQDPRGCFRQFFHKAKVREIHLIIDVYECCASYYGFYSVAC